MGIWAMENIIDIRDILLFNRYVTEQERKQQEKLSQQYEQESPMLMQLKYIRDLQLLAEINWSNMMKFYRKLEGEERPNARFIAWRKAKRCRDEFYGHQLLIQKAIKTLKEIM